METVTTEHPKGKGHWYYKHTTYCVICGRTDVERERRPPPKPADAQERERVDETACAKHF